MTNNIETTEVQEKKQYIVVKLGSEQYGIDISYVDNIVRMQKITRVPKAQPYFKGIINLRGEIVPVMSIRLKMGFEDDTFTNASRIIILKIEEQGKIIELQSERIRKLSELLANYMTMEELGEMERKGHT